MRGGGNEGICAFPFNGHHLSQESATKADFPPVSLKILN